MEILKFIFILLEVVLLFNLIILVHELGHFWAARWRGLAVDRFGIWFGKPLWQKKIKGVTYSLGIIPFGGFVSIPQMAPMEVVEGKVESEYKNLPPAKPVDKIIVAAAGPLFSFLLAIIFAFIVWGIGRPVSETETTRVVGFVLKGSPAEEAGLQEGDEIIAIDGHPIVRWSGIGDSVQWRIISSEGETIKITVLRNGQITNLIAKPRIEETKIYERKALRNIQILPKETPIIAKLFDNSPAALAGLKPNDIVLEANGKKLLSPAALSSIVWSSTNQPVTLKIKRGNQELTFTVKPVIPEITVVEGRNIKTLKEDLKPMLGIVWEQGGIMNTDHPNPYQQIVSTINMMANTIRVIASPRTDVKLQHLSGPVGIMRIYYRLFESDQGWRLAIWFSVILNVNLAILNFLPIPLLDGGHIVMSIIEIILRRQLSYKVLNIIHTTCAVIIFGYIIYITIFDTQELAIRRQKTEIKFKANPEAVSKP